MDISRVVKHILERIPEKFLTGLSEIRIFDPKEENLYVKYVSKTDKQPMIDIYMDNSMLQRTSFFSILFFNIIFITAINEHIEKYVKPLSNDKEILSIPRRITYEWIYLGRATFIFVSILQLLNYLISKFQICRNIAYRLAYLVVKNGKKHK